MKGPKLQIKNKTLGNLRRKAGFKTAEIFADFVGLSIKSIQRYESLGGTYIPMHAAWKIADALNCSIDDVVGRETSQAGIDSFIYNNLSDRSKKDLVDYIDYLEARDKIEKWKESCKDD